MLPNSSASRYVWYLLPAAGVLVCAYLGYHAMTSRQYVLLRSTAPDGSLCAVADVFERTGIARPPEPAPVRARYHTLTIRQGADRLLTTDATDLDCFSGVGDSVDALWCENSQKLAYRLANDLLIIDPHAKLVRTYSPVKAPDFIATFRWIDEGRLVLVTKRVDHVLPWKYSSYVENSRAVDLWSLDVSTGSLVHLAHWATSAVPFLFRGAAFQMDELSPFNAHVGFSCGGKFLVYDYGLGQTVHASDLSGSLDGVWWVDQDTCVLGIDTLVHKPRFLRITVTTHVVEDVTGCLNPHWRGKYDDIQWYLPGLK